MSQAGQHETRKGAPVDAVAPGARRFPRDIADEAKAAAARGHLAEAATLYVDAARASMSASNIDMYAKKAQAITLLRRDYRNGRPWAIEEVRKLRQTAEPVCPKCGRVMDCDLMTGTPHCQCEYDEPRCQACHWIHEADSTAGTSFQGVGLCPLHGAASDLLGALQGLLEVDFWPHGQEQVDPKTVDYSAQDHMDIEPDCPVCVAIRTARAAVKTAERGA